VAGTKLCVKVKITNDRKVGLHGGVPREAITPIMSLRKLNMKYEIMCYEQMHLVNCISQD